MKIVTTVLLTVTLSAVASIASAQQPLDYRVTVAADIAKGSSDDHFVTFSGPVHVPDVTLPAGTYVFRLLPSSVIQVRSTDGTETYGMFFTRPASRLEPTDDYDVRLKLRRQTAPPRVSQIFLPGRSLGFEFVYDEARGDR
jgi:hypothetical protein